MVLSESMIELPIKSGITCTIPILNFTIVTFIFMSCWINNAQAWFDPLQHDASCLILLPPFTESVRNTSTIEPLQRSDQFSSYERFPFTLLNYMCSCNVPCTMCHRRATRKLILRVFEPWPINLLKPTCLHTKVTSRSP